VTFIKRYSLNSSRQFSLVNANFRLLMPVFDLSGGGGCGVLVDDDLLLVTDCKV